MEAAVVVLAAAAAVVVVVAMVRFKEVVAAVAFLGQDHPVPLLCANLVCDLSLRLEAELTPNRALGSKKEGPNRAAAGEEVGAAKCCRLY